MPVYKYKNAKGKDMYYVKYNNTTKRGFATRADAKKYESGMAIAELIGPEEDIITYREVAESYLESQEMNCTFGTYQKSKGLLEKYVFPNIVNKDIKKYTELECEKFKKYLCDLPNATTHKNDILRRFEAVFKYACRYYDLKVNPARFLTPIKSSFKEKQKRMRMEVWTEYQFNQFIQYVDKPDYEALFVVLFFTGMRLGEALALNWNDLEYRRISVEKSLTRKSANGGYEIKEPKSPCSIRTIDLNISLYEYLMRFKEAKEKIPGFDNSWFIFGNISPLPQVTIDREKDAAIAQSGVPRIRIHDFRHSHASNLIASGANIVAVSKRLGHSDVNITLSTYTHLLTKSNDELVSSLEESSQNLLRNISNAH